MKGKPSGVTNALKEVCIPEKSKQNESCVLKNQNISFKCRFANWIGVESK